MICPICSLPIRDSGQERKQTWWCRNISQRCGRFDAPSISEVSLRASLGLKFTTARGLEGGVDAPSVPEVSLRASLELRVTTARGLGGVNAPSVPEVSVRASLELRVTSAWGCEGLGWCGESPLYSWGVPQGFPWVQGWLLLMAWQSVMFDSYFSYNPHLVCLLHISVFQTPISPSQPLVPPTHIPVTLMSTSRSWLFTLTSSIFPCSLKSCSPHFCPSDVYVSLIPIIHYDSLSLSLSNTYVHLLFPHTHIFPVTSHPCPP